MRYLDVANRAVDHYKAAQDPGELAALLALLAVREGPQDVLEIGTGLGGSAWAFAQVPAVRQVVTITQPGSVGYSDPGMLNGKVHVILGDSHTEPIRAIAAAWGPAEGYDLVFIDGDHTYEGVCQDYLLYGPLCAPGGLVVFHDTQDFPGRDDHRVSSLWAGVRQRYPSIELVSCPGGPFGTGVMWWIPEVLQGG